MGRCRYERLSRYCAGFVIPGCGRQSRDVGAQDEHGARRYRAYNRTKEPGYAGKPRFNLERSVAILHCDSAGVTAEYFQL